MNELTIVTVIPVEVEAAALLRVAVAPLPEVVTAVTTAVSDVLEVLVKVTVREVETATALLKVTVVPEMEVTVVSSEIGVMTVE